MTLCRIPKQTCAFYKKWEREILPPRGHTQGQNPFPYKCIKRDYIICAGVYIKRVLQKITFDAICDMFTCIKNIHFFFFKVSSAFKKKKKEAILKSREVLPKFSFFILLSRQEEEEEGQIKSLTGSLPLLLRKREFPELSYRQLFWDWQWVGNLRV